MLSGSHSTHGPLPACSAYVPNACYVSEQAEAMVATAQRHARKWSAGCRVSPAVPVSPVLQRLHAHIHHASAALCNAEVELLNKEASSQHPEPTAPAHELVGPPTNSQLPQSVLTLQNIKEQVLNEAVGGAAEAFATLKKVHQLWCSSPHKPWQAAYLADILPALSLALTKHTQQLKPRELVRAAILLGELPGCSPLVVAALCDAARGQLSSVSATSLAALLPVLVQLGVRRSDALLADIMKEVEPHLGTLSGSQLVSLLVCLVRLGVRPATPWLYAWEDASRPELQGLGCDNLSSVMWALSEISFTPAAGWMAGYLGATQHRLAQASCQQLVDVMQGLARLGANNMLSAAWKKQALKVSGACMLRMTSSQLTRLLTAACALGLQPDAAWVSNAAWHGRLTLLDSSPRDALDLLLSLSQLQPLPQQEQQAQQPAASPTVSNHHSSSASNSSVAASTAAAAVGRRVAASRQGAGSSAGGAAAATAVADSVALSQQGTSSASTNSSATINTSTIHASNHTTSGGGAASETATRIAVSGALVGAAASTNNTATVQMEEWAGRDVGVGQQKGRRHWFTRKWRYTFLLHTLRLLPRFTAAGLVHLLTALAAVGAKPNWEWCYAYLHVLHQKLEVLGPAELAALPQGLLHVTDQPASCQDLLARWSAVSSLKLSSMSDAQLVSMVKALQRFGAEASQLDATWQQAFLHEAHKRASNWPTCDVAVLPYVVVKLRLQPAPSWWAQLFSVLLQPGHLAGLRQLDTADLSNLLWAVTISGQQPPSKWVSAVMAAARARVEEGRAHSQGLSCQSSSLHSGSQPNVATSQRHAHHRRASTRARRAAGTVNLRASSASCIAQASATTHM